MSLITLNSDGQNPSLFSCHFPQPIKLEPYSQVCLLKFLHFRDTNIYNLTTSNNELQYCIGNTLQDALRVARVVPGEYTGTELALAITTAMNNVLQQQNFTWLCTFIPTDATTSPPTEEGFKIEYSSLPKPTPAVLDYDTQLGTNVFISGGDFKIENSLPDPPLLALPKLTAIASKGIITSGGEQIIADIPLSAVLYLDSNPSDLNSFGFNELTVGIVRNELSSLENANPNLVFDPTLQDVSLNFDDNGLQISTINLATGAGQLGQPGYATTRPCRVLQKSFFQKFITVGDGFTARTDDDVANMRFQLFSTFFGTARRVVVRIKVSYDLGLTYSPVPSAQYANYGTDARGNNLIKSKTINGEVIDSIIWVSDDEDMNDLLPGTTTNARKLNIVSTRKAPFKATITPNTRNEATGGVDFLDTDGLGTVWRSETALGPIATWSAYTGIHGYDFVLNIPNIVDPYYIIQKLKLTAFANTTASVFDYKISINIDEDPNNPVLSPLSDGTFTYGAGGNNVFTLFPGAAEPKTLLQTAGAGLITTEIMLNRSYKQTGIANPIDRPLTLQNVADGSLFENEETIINQYADNNEVGAANVESGLGADISKTAFLLLRQLNAQDIVANSGSPAYLKNGQSSGTIGSTIGSSVNIALGNSSTGQIIFTSGQSVQKISKDTIIKISVPELSGIKSFNGIDQSNAGRNLSGIGKDLAILPREEFATTLSNINGSLVYVAPFENWLDVNNAQELHINQLSVEVRQPNGQITGDLRPDTICQIKMREDPKQEARRQASLTFDNMVLAMSSATKSGQVLSTNLNNRGS